MSAKLKFKNLSGFNKKIEKRIRKAMSSEKVLKNVGDIALDHIRQDYALGKNPETGKDHPKVKNQKAKDRIAKAHSSNRGDFHKKVNNLSDQLRKSLRFKIKRGKPRVEIDATGIHKPYKNKKGKSIGKPISNSKLLSYLNEKRQVFGLSKGKKREITEAVKRQIRRELK